MPYEQGLPGEHPPKRISPGILPQPHAALLLHTCAVGPEPSLQSKHCPSTALPRCSPSPTIGAAYWSEQTAPGSQSLLFSLKGLTLAHLLLPGWDSHSSSLSVVSFKHHTGF